MKADKRKLASFETGPKPEKSIKVNIRRMEELGLIGPVYGRGPIKVDKRKLQLVEIEPRPDGHTVKVSLARLEELGLYERLPEDDAQNPLHVKIGSTIYLYRRQACIAAGFVVGVIGLSVLCIVSVPNTDTGHVEMAKLSDQEILEAPVITYIMDDKTVENADEPAANIAEPAVEGTGEKPVTLEEETTDPSVIEEGIPEGTADPEETPVTFFGEEGMKEQGEVLNLFDADGQPAGEYGLVMADSDMTIDELVMANVDTACNVRAEASEDAEKTGMLYRDCGGTVLEQKDGWTKIASGELTGWVKDDYLFFDEDAKDAADEAGSLIATVEADVLNIRKDPDTESMILGVASQAETLAVVDADSEWVEVEFGGGTGFISSDYADVSLWIPTGETVEEVEVVQEPVEETVEETTDTENLFEPENTQPAVTMEGVTANANDINMMAAMIYCEAGNQSYVGQVAVGAVIVNRLESPLFPNTVFEVLSAPRQFQPYAQGKFDRVYNAGSWSDSCYQAAMEALAGGKGGVGNALYFRNPEKAGSHDGIILGDHVFW